MVDVLTQTVRLGIMIAFNKIKCDCRDPIWAYSLAYSHGKKGHHFVFCVLEGAAADEKDGIPFSTTFYRVPLRHQTSVRGFRICSMQKSKIVNA